MQLHALFAVHCLSSPRGVGVSQCVNWSWAWGTCRKLWSCSGRSRKYVAGERGRGGKKSRELNLTGRRRNRGSDKMKDCQGKQASWRESTWGLNKECRAMKTSRGMNINRGNRITEVWCERQEFQGPRDSFPRADCTIALMLNSNTDSFIINHKKVVDTPPTSTTPAPPPHPRHREQGGRVHFRDQNAVSRNEGEALEK